MTSKALLSTTVMHVHVVFGVEDALSFCYRRIQMYSSASGCGLYPLSPDIVFIDEPRVDSVDGILGRPEAIDDFTRSPVFAIVERVWIGDAEEVFVEALYIGLC